MTGVLGVCSWKGADIFSSLLHLDQLWDLPSLLPNGGKQADLEVDHLTPSMLRMFTAGIPKSLHPVVLN
jgi:hypothetical protein